MKLTLLLTLLLFASASFGQNFNRPYPNTLSPYEFVRVDQTNQGKHFLIAPFFFFGNTGIAKSMQVVDEDGYIAWFSPGEFKPFDFKYHPSIDRYSFNRRSSNVVKHFEMNSDFELVDSIVIPTDFYADAHEFNILPNGDRCIIAIGDTLMDLSSYNFNGIQGGPNANVVYGVILIYDSSGNLVFQWESTDHLTVDHFSPTFTYNSSYLDYLHLNSVELDADGNLIASMRTADMVCKIDRTTGDIIWKLGGNYSDFTFTNDAGFFGQHDARRLPNGNISVFDNDLSSNHARGVEFQLDTVNWTATRVNQTNYPFNFPASSMGSFRTMDNGYTITGWGNSRRPAPSVTLFDPSGIVASDFFFTDTVITYRAFFQELPTLPARQTITCEETQTGITLSVPDTSIFYLWSTNESPSSIDIAGTGIFQCWVKQGMGMMGSYPIEIINAGECPIVQVPELIPTAKKAVTYYDLQGRKINSPINGTPYLIEYSDGSIERKFTSTF